MGTQRYLVLRDFTKKKHDQKEFKIRCVSATQRLSYRKTLDNLVLKIDLLVSNLFHLSGEAAFILDFFLLLVYLLPLPLQRLSKLSRLLF